jgi:hypothetical protein
MFLCLSTRVLYPREIKAITEIQIPPAGATPLSKGGQGGSGILRFPLHYSLNAIPMASRQAAGR